MTIAEATKAYCLRCTRRSECQHPCPTVLDKILTKENSDEDY